MGASKIQNEQEVLRWFEEGRTYEWMCEQYRTKYNIETQPSMWGNFRRRRGLDKRIVRDESLIPWAVKPEHRWAYAVTMLRTEARRRQGQELSEETAHRLDVWKQNLAEDGAVIHYDPDTAEGFFRVPARPGIDTDLVRVPDKQTSRRNAE